MTGGTGVMDVDAFRDTLRGASQGKLNEHEIMTVARFYQVSSDKNLVCHKKAHIINSVHFLFYLFVQFKQDRSKEGTNPDQLVAIAQEQLRKANFEEFSKLADQCNHMDSSQ